MARRPALRLLVVPQRRQALERIVLHATSLRIPIVEVEGGTLNSVAGFDGHQGVALVVRPRAWASIEDVLARAAERGEPPFVLVLDSLEDPQNVGTLLRSAEAVGAHGVLFPTHHQAPLSPAAIKASAGATEHLLLVPVDDLPGALADLHVHGVRVVGADEDAPLTARQADLRGPIALVVGSEGQGIGPAVRRRIDLTVRIPMRGAIGSLNASVAGSVLLFEMLEQRGEAPAAPRPKSGWQMPWVQGGSSPVAAESEPDPAANSTATSATSATNAEPNAMSSAASDRERGDGSAAADPKRRKRTGARAVPQASVAPETEVAETGPEAAPDLPAAEAPEDESVATTASARRLRKRAASPASSIVAASSVVEALEPAAPVTRARPRRTPGPAADVPVAAPPQRPARRGRPAAGAAADPEREDLLPGGPAPSPDPGDLA